MRGIVSIGILALAVLLAVGAVEAQHGMMGMEMRSPISREKSPEIGALLSLMPLPVALGNFYAGDWERGVLYTTIEVALAFPVWLCWPNGMGTIIYGMMRITMIMITRDGAKGKERVSPTW